MTFKLQINTDNAAFEEWQREVARILHELADALDRDYSRTDKWMLRDFNGNGVGHAVYLTNCEE